MVQTQVSQPFYNRDNACLQRQVRWREASLVQAGIDQTQVAIAAAPEQPASFSFLVVGDTDSGPSQPPRPSLALGLAEQLQAELDTSQFVLHTGDLVYPLGGYRNYYDDFVLPYAGLIAEGPSGPGDRHQALRFTKPVLPVPGNHDYGDLAPLGRFWMGLVQNFGDRLRQWGIDLGGYGGYGGQAYGQTFLDDLARFHHSPGLTQYLAEHYSVPTPRGYALAYEPGRFTRLPNRYYSFRYGGIDFFGLDSNTWNYPRDRANFDTEQLDWLEARLIESWQTPEVMGRILYLHHAPYTTEETRWQESETLWVRRHLRRVLDQVAIATEAQRTQQRSTPIVDLVLSGHSHCLEHIRTGQTGHGDSGLDWVVCGGGGESLRRQRKTGADILEVLQSHGRSYTEMVAKSQFYLGVKGHGSKRQCCYSFLRVDVKPRTQRGVTQALLRVRPLVVSWDGETWQRSPLRPLELRNSVLQPS